MTTALTMAARLRIRRPSHDRNDLSVLAAAGVAVTIRRGRLTATEARLQVDLTGSPARVRAALAAYEAQGVLDRNAPDNPGGGLLSGQQKR